MGISLPDKQMFRSGSEYSVDFIYFFAICLIENVQDSRYFLLLYVLYNINF